jgi:hypothetical protein
MNNDALFCQKQWHQFVTDNKEALENELNSIDGNRLLNTSEEDLVKYFIDKYYFDVPEINEDEILIEQHEVNIDVSQDPLCVIYDRSKPFYVKGTKVTFYIPFNGDECFFQICPNSFTLTVYRGYISDKKLICSISDVELNPEKIKSQMGQYLQNIKGYLETQKNDSIKYNQTLEGTIRGKIKDRKDKLIKDRNLVMGLGFKLKESDTMTYTAPEVKRRILQLPNASKQPYKPEPVLRDDDYENILNILDNMTKVMERSPKVFSEIDEESLRTHFLVQLNGHYDGEATGETFNYNGKTDILIRSNGKNIFIAECKYWKGEKKYLETIDQILSYASWRDTKVAILVFNRNKNFTEVLKTIEACTKRHKNFKKERGIVGETRFKYVFANREDANRELLITVMVFDIPTGQNKSQTI